jgi:hypothetical protein
VWDIMMVLPMVSMHVLMHILVVELDNVYGRILTIDRRIQTMDVHVIVEEIIINDHVKKMKGSSIEGIKISTMAMKKIQQVKHSSSNSSSSESVFERNEMNQIHENLREK